MGDRCRPTGRREAETRSVAGSCDNDGRILNGDVASGRLRKGIPAPALRLPDTSHKPFPEGAFARFGKIDRRAQVNLCILLRSDTRMALA